MAATDWLVAPDPFHDKLERAAHRRVLVSSMDAEMRLMYEGLRAEHDRMRRIEHRPNVLKTTLFALWLLVVLPVTLILAVWVFYDVMWRWVLPTFGLVTFLLLFIFLDVPIWPFTAASSALAPSKDRIIQVQGSAEEQARWNDEFGSLVARLSAK